MIGIIGVGSLGKNLLDSLQRKLPHEQFVVIDGDVVNKNNIQYNVKYVGRKKVNSCESQYSNVTGICEYIESNKLSPKIQKIINQCSTIFDCRDTFEDRQTFDAIKLFINKDKLIIDFRKTISFRFEVEGEYVSYINNQFIKSLIVRFVNMFCNEKIRIVGYITDRTAISINQIGMIENLHPSQNVSHDYIEKLITCENNNIKHVNVDILDGMYNLKNESFQIYDNNISEIVNNIVTTIRQEIDNFPAVYTVPSIRGDTLQLNIINQIGGA